MSGIDEQDSFKLKVEYYCAECREDYDENEWCFDAAMCAHCCDECNGSGEY